MNLSTMLAERADAGRPIRIGQIGAGKFGTMFLAQLRLTRGMHLTALADLLPSRAQRAVDRRRMVAGADRCEIHRRRNQDRQDICHRRSDGPDQRSANRSDHRGDRRPGKRHPRRRSRHCCRQAHHHGQCRSRRARRTAACAQGPRGWRRLQHGLGRPTRADLRACRLGATCGFEVVCAGKGTRYHPTYHASTPDTVFDILDTYLKIDNRSHINPKMFNSFVDGTKSGIEMTAVCNATGLVPQTDGLSFPPATPFRTCTNLQAEGGTAACSKSPASPK